MTKLKKSTTLHHINQRIFNKARNIHFIGIGGIGMSGIARIMGNIGFTISGSDLKKSQITDSLQKEGCTIYIGHNRKNIKNCDVIVTSSAVSPVNEEILEARDKGITVIHRGEMLAELMRLKYGIAVAGTHGKTTTTSLTASVCIEGGLNPTSVIGGNFLKINSNSSLGVGDILICEADESDGSFLKLNPSLSIVTNIDLDHMDYYKTEQNLITHFVNFLNKTPFYGKNIVCFEDKRLRKLSTQIEKPYMTYGFKKGLDLYADKVRFEQGVMKYQVYYKDKFLADFSLKILGQHNVLNSLAAIAVGLELDLPLAKIKKGISSFEGVARRMYSLGSINGYRIIDDYGHHPTEIRATIKALKLVTNDMIVIFQPHRYTRTLNLYKEFADSLSNIKNLIITDIYPADETPIRGVTSELILKELKISKNHHAYYVHKRDELKSLVKKLTSKKTKNGIVLTIGAGDIYKTGQELADEKK